MKTLSVKQPYAYLLCAGIKDIENRTWKLPVKYRGERVLIHASGAKMEGIEGDYFNEDQIGHLYCGHTPLEELHKYHSLRNQYSAIIGSVRIVDCVINHPSIWANKSNPIDYSHLGFPIKYDKKFYNWIVADPIMFDKPLLNVKGKSNLWESYHEPIICPECGQIQCAKVEDTAPFFTYIHDCEKCGYTITESEWERVK